MRALRAVKKEPKISVHITLHQIDFYRMKMKDILLFELIQ